MRIVIVTQNEYLYLPMFFARFLPAAAAAGIEITSILLLRPFNESLRETARRMLDFYGPADFLRQGTRYGLRRACARLGLTADSIPAQALRHGIFCQTERDINSPLVREVLCSEKPDVLLSVGATQIFKHELLCLPRWGCLNIHTANLPRYRGVLPTFWALYHGDAAVGMTIFRMDEVIDRGQIVLQEELPITARDTLDSLIRKTKVHEADMALRALQLISAGQAELQPYEGEGSYFTFPTRQDVRALRQRGRRLL